MARRKYYRRRYNRENELEKAVTGILTLSLIALVWYFFTHQKQIMFYGIISLVILIVGYIIYFFLKKKCDVSWNFNDDEILFMLKGMSPSQFEDKIADMFDGLGYKTEVVGGANDGGIDIVAYKDGKKYFIQCKKFITQEVTPHDVRDFLGAITNINNPVEKGFFVTTGVFTIMAEKAAEGNPRIELIDGLKLVEYYKLSYGKTAPENTPAHPIENQNTKTCPQCGGRLEIKIAHKGDYAGQQFLGCSNFPKCKYIKNIE